MVKASLRYRWRHGFTTALGPIFLFFRSDLMSVTHKSILSLAYHI